MTHPTCAYCREPLPPAAKTGRKRRYCSSACRDAAYRDRQAASEVWETVGPADPVDEDALRAMTVEAVVAEMQGIAPASPEERLIRAVLETRVLGSQYLQLSQQVRSELAWRSQQMGEAVLDDLARYFGEENAR